MDFVYIKNEEIMLLCAVLIVLVLNGNPYLALNVNLQNNHINTYSQLLVERLEFLCSYSSLGPIHPSTHGVSRLMTGKVFSFRCLIEIQLLQEIHIRRRSYQQ